MILVTLAYMTATSVFSAAAGTERQSRSACYRSAKVQNFGNITTMPVYPISNIPICMQACKFTGTIYLLFSFTLKQYLFSLLILNALNSFNHYLIPCIRKLKTT